jgi:hypothetical protein
MFPFTPHTTSRLRHLIVSWAVPFLGLTKIWVIYFLSDRDIVLNKFGSDRVQKFR